MRVVLGIDGSETARAAVRFAAALPFPAGTDVYLLSVVEPVLRRHEIEALSRKKRETLDTAARRAHQEARELLESEATVLRDAGLAVTTQVPTGHPAGEIVAAAEAHDADLIVVGSHGLTGFRRFLLGSVSDQVFQSARRSVLIVRADDHSCDGKHPGPPALRDHPWRFLAGYDASPSSEKAVEFCMRLDLDERMSVRLLTVLPVVRMFRQDIRQELDEIWRQKKDAEKAALHAAADRVRRTPAAVTTALVEADDVTHAILAAGDEFDADLIVLGHKGKGAIERFLMGSVTPRIVHHACRSVLAVR
jgi:nucleotide-binding universal stress UspA family protein